MKIYNKLVRDRIPEIIEKDNRVAKTKVLDDVGYRQELLKKIVEESIEVKEAYGNKEDLVKEIGDLLEVIDSTLKAFNLSMEEVIKLKEKRRIERGGFEKRIFLESVE